MFTIALALAMAPAVESSEPLSARTAAALTTASAQTAKPQVQRPNTAGSEGVEKQPVQLADGMSRLNGGANWFFDPDYWTWWISQRASTRPTCTKSAACSG